MADEVERRRLVQTRGERAERSVVTNDDELTGVRCGREALVVGDRRKVPMALEQSVQTTSMSELDVDDQAGVARVTARPSADGCQLAVPTDGLDLRGRGQMRNGAG